MNAMNKFKQRFDGFMNVLQSLGPVTPNTHRGRFSSSFSGVDLCELYMTNGLAQKIVDRPSDDATQRGVEVEGDEDNLMSDEYDRLQVMAKFANALRWSRLMGGAVILLIAKDGNDLTEPLDLNNLDTIEELRVYDVSTIRPTDRYYENVDDPTTYGKMEYYELLPPGVNVVLVHESRLILIGGEPIPTRYVVGRPGMARLPWVGRSILESSANDIWRYQQGLEWSLRLLERKQQAVYNMTGLGEMFEAGDDEMVRKRINLVDTVRNNLTSVVVDKDDSYTVLNAGMDGVDTTLKSYQVALSASSNMPMMILFGEQATGLSNTGAGNLESYYGMVSHIQNVIARPALEKLTAILWLQKSLSGKVPDKWKIEFNPLWIATDLEIAQAKQAEQIAYSTEATKLISLMDSSILSPEEVREIIVDSYSEYDFSLDLPEQLADVNYAEGVDNTLMDVPSDPNPPGVKPINVTTK